VDRLILDTGVLIAAVRGRTAVPDDTDVAVPAVVVAEYLAGVHLDTDAGRQAAQRAFLHEVLDVVPICDYDQTVANHHASLLAFTAREGCHRGPHDLIIAATARASGRIILTTDLAAKFDELPDVKARIATQS
jgi:tRNA(fMet)-specific endonuclease VapC